MRLARFHLALLLLAGGAAQGAMPLQPLIDVAATGAVLRLAPGDYQGPVRISRTLVLDGGGQARVLGDGRSTVIEIAADGATLRGLRIAGSGDSHDRADAGVLVQGRGVQLIDNELDDVLFGIHLKGAVGGLVRGNRVRGKALPSGLRGDALRLWNSRDNRIEANRFERARDLTLINSSDNRLHGNHFDDGRYGLHVVFSPRLVAEANRLERMATGIVLLYSREARLLGNRVAHTQGGGGAGIVVKESDDARIEGNRLLHNAVGLKLDSPVEGRSALAVRDNWFVHNAVALSFYGEAGAGLFSGNRFEHNLHLAAISAAGAGAGYRWRGNHWDDYQGFDRDGDQIGDQPHEVLVFADRLWMETPLASFFRNSPALELLDFLERLAPFTSPTRVLLDPQPRLARRVPLETRR